MPANLSPQYYEAEEAYRRAKTSEDKMAALQEMLSAIPKHKGTEKLQADIKKKISQLKDESKKKKSSKGSYNPFNVEKQGAGQVVLVGYPNSGKSSLVASLTRAKAKVAHYPFSTSLPLAGMMPYEDTAVQLVDTPPVTKETVPSGLMGTLKEADALLLVVDAASDECLEQLEGCLELLQEREVIDLSEEGEIVAPVPFLIVASKMDEPGAGEHLELLKEFNPELDIRGISSEGMGLEELKEELFRVLDVIRVYGKPNDKAADMNRPFILRRGSTVTDFAASIHKDFPQKMKSALVWGSARFDGQAVARDHVLEDGDIVELQLQ